MALPLLLNSYLNTTINPGQLQQFTVTAIPYLVTAVIFQIQADKLNATIGIGPDSDPLSHVIGNGTSGFMQRFFGTENTSSCFISTRASVPINVQIGARSLGPEDPVPGGCALQFPQPHVPLLLYNYPKSRRNRRTGYYIQLDWPGIDAPYSRTDNSPEGHCEERDIFSTVVDYRLFVDFLGTTSKDFDSTTSFNAVKQFSKPENVTNLGSKICKLSGGSGNKLWLPSWPGRPFVLNVLVNNNSNGHSSCYIPLILNTGADNGVVLSVSSESWGTWIMLGVTIVAGVFLTFFGHKVFNLAQAILGFIGAFYVGFVMLYRFADDNALPFDSLVGIAAVVGVFGGLLMLIIWESTGNPFIASFSSCLLFGLCLAFTFSYFVLDEWNLLNQNPPMYFLAFASIVLITPAFLLFFQKNAHVISCAGIGAFAIVVPISYFTGTGTLHYIFVRSVERFVYEWFQGNWCFIVPFFTADIVLSVAWVALFVVGISIQLHITLGDPPFPSPYLCAKLRRRGQSDTEPLVNDSEVNVSPITTNSSTYGTTTS